MRYDRPFKIHPPQRTALIGEFPDYLTQCASIAQLEENLRDLYRDLINDEIPGIRRIAELSIG